MNIFQTATWGFLLLLGGILVGGISGYKINSWYEASKALKTTQEQIARANNSSDTLQLRQNKLMENYNETKSSLTNTFNVTCIDANELRNINEFIDTSQSKPAL